MRTVKNITFLPILTLTGLVILLNGNAAQAFPAFSTKEKKPCSYCHVNAKGGGKRNAAGDWYKKHGLSFAGYTPAKAATAPKPKPAATPKAKKKTAPKPPAKNKA